MKSRRLFAGKPAETERALVRHHGPGNLAKILVGPPVVGQQALVARENRRAGVVVAVDVPAFPLLGGVSAFLGFVVPMAGVGPKTGRVDSTKNLGRLVAKNLPVIIPDILPPGHPVLRFPELVDVAPESFKRRR